MDACGGLRASCRAEGVDDVAIALLQLSRFGCLDPSFA